MLTLNYSLTECFICRIAHEPGALNARTMCVSAAHMNILIWAFNIMCGKLTLFFALVFVKPDSRRHTVHPAHDTHDEL